jgi:intersectin
MVSVLRNPANCGFSDLDECIGAVLCEHLPNQAPYVVFCSNQVKISELIREKTAESCKFDEFLRACSQEPRLQGLPLTTAYVKPMQRITRYPLLIKRILELTADSHPDLPNLKEALLKAEDLCRKVNERVRQTENLERFEWLQTHVALEEFSEKIKFNSTTNFLGARTLLYSGTLFKVPFAISFQRPIHSSHVTLKFLIIPKKEIFFQKKPAVTICERSSKIFFFF